MSDKNKIPEPLADNFQRECTKASSLDILSSEDMQLKLRLHCDIAGSVRNGLKEEDAKYFCALARLALALLYEDGKLISLEKINDAFYRKIPLYQVEAIVKVNPKVIDMIPIDIVKKLPDSVFEKLDFKIDDEEIGFGGGHPRF